MAKTAQRLVFWCLHKMVLRYFVCPVRAHVAELADACGSGPHGVTLGGSNPLVSTSGSPFFIVESILSQTDPEFVRSTFSSISKRYDFANHLLSGGLDYYWRFRVARKVSRLSPGRVLDLATGSGDLAIALKKSCPLAAVTAADFCLPMLNQARRKGVARLVQADALALPFADSSFDVVTVAFGLRNMASWPGALREMARVLQPGGTLIILDFSLPEWEIFRNIYRFYLHRILPSIAGWATKRPAAYEYLGESIESFPSGLTMTAMMTSCGFSSEPPLPLTGGIVTLYSGKTKDD